MAQQDIQQKVTQLNTQLQVLDRKFAGYVSGQEKLPPVREFAEFLLEMEKLAKTKSTAGSVSQRYFITTFQQRFISYRTKWENLLRGIEDGRIKRGKVTRR